MNNTDRLEKYLKFNNLTLFERRIAGSGNLFEVWHQYPNERHIRVLGEFMLTDQDMINMGGLDPELVAYFILKHTQEIVTDVSDKSDSIKYSWSLRPSRLI